MEAWIIFVGIGVGLTMVASWRRLDRTSQQRPVKHSAGRPAGLTTSAGDVANDGEVVPSEEPYQGLPDTYVLVGPPMVVSTSDELHTGLGAVPLRDWLLHYHPKIDNVWRLVVSEFYSVAAADPVIGDYFTGAQMATLKRHFLRALLVLTGDGLTVGTVRLMQVKHAGVRNSAGEPITPAVFDAAMGVLGGIFTSKGVPDEALRQVEFMLMTLRPAIVAGPDGDWRRQ